ncbi:Glutamate-rich WD repeat-containing protein 1, partial [Perkinsus olseni]
RLLLSLYSIIMPRAATGSSATKRAHNEDALPEGKTRDKKAFQSKLEKEKTEQADGLEFEDPVEDEFEKEEIIDGDASDAEMAAEEEDAAAAGGTAVYRPGVDKVEEGEELVLGDPTMYTMLHRAEVEWPCLSFDTIQDNLGASRKKYPMTCYVVAGTQADTAKNNKIVVMKWSHMYK